MTSNKSPFKKYPTDMHVSHSIQVTTNNNQVFCLGMQIQKQQPVGISDFAYANVSIMILMKL